MKVVTEVEKERPLFYSLGMEYSPNSRPVGHREALCSGKLKTRHKVLSALI